jgi:hypothetical protein
MRVISSEELDLVSGGENDDTHHAVAKKADDGGFLGSIGNFISGLFGGGSAPSSNSCVPSSSSSGSGTTTQTCGAGGVSTVTTTGPGYFSQTTTAPNPGVTASGRYGPGAFSGSYNGGHTVTTITCIGGRCSGPTSRRQ